MSTPVSRDAQSHTIPEIPSTVNDSRLGDRSVADITKSSGCFSQLLSRIWSAITRIFAKLFGKKPATTNLNGRVQEGPVTTLKEVVVVNSVSPEKVSEAANELKRHRDNIDGLLYSDDMQRDLKSSRGLTLVRDCVEAPKKWLNELDPSIKTELETKYSKEWNGLTASLEELSTNYEKAKKEDSSVTVTLPKITEGALEDAFERGHSVVIKSILNRLDDTQIKEIMIGHLDNNEAVQNATARIRKHTNFARNAKQIDLIKAYISKLEKLEREVEKTGQVFVLVDQLTTVADAPTPHETAQRRTQRVANEGTLLKTAREQFYKTTNSKAKTALESAIKKLEDKIRKEAGALDKEAKTVTAQLKSYAGTSLDENITVQGHQRAVEKDAEGIAAFLLKALKSGPIHDSLKEALTELQEKRRTPPSSPRSNSSSPRSDYRHVRTTGPHNAIETEKTIAFCIKKADEYVLEIRTEIQKIDRMSEKQIRAALDNRKMSFWKAVAGGIMNDHVETNLLQQEITRYRQLLTRRTIQ